MDVLVSEPNVSDHVLVVGRHPLQSYVRFVKSRGASGAKVSERQLVQDWREMQRSIAETNEREIGVADNPQFIPIPDEMIPTAEEARQQEATRRSLGRSPFQWWLVEIDRTVVFQPWVDLSFVREIQASVSKPVSHLNHIRIASGHHMTKPVVNATQSSEDRFVFTSRSTDVRFLGTTLLDPASIQNGPSYGYATHVVAVFLGSGINCLSALHINNRLVLMNGTHRAYALREMGFTHVACLVTHAENEQEASGLLPQTVKQDEARFLAAPRPPLFKDYFDASVRKIVPTKTASMLLKLKLKESKELIPTP